MVTADPAAASGRTTTCVTYTSVRGRNMPAPKLSIPSATSRARRLPLIADEATGDRGTDRKPGQPSCGITRSP